MKITQDTRIRFSEYLADVAREADRSAGKIGKDADCSRWYFIRLSETFDIPVYRLELFAEGAISALTNEQVARLAAAGDI